MAVTGSHRFASVAAGEEHTCGVDADGLAWCWGANRAGWLGDGTLEGRAEPAPVQQP